MLKLTNIKQLRILLTKRYVSYFDESMENEYDDGFFDFIAHNYSLLMLSLNDYKPDVSFECYYDNTVCNEIVFIFRHIINADNCYCWGIDDNFAIDEISENMFHYLLGDYINSQHNWEKIENDFCKGDK